MKKVVKSGLYTYVYLFIITTIAAVFGTLNIIGVGAQEMCFDVNNITYRITSEGAFPEVEVHNCNVNYNGGIILPESVINPNNNVEYSITGIAGSAFRNCKSLTSIVIPYGITSIGSNAFAGCENLKKVILSEDTKLIPDFCFNMCSSLTTVTTPSNLDNDGNPKVSGVYLPNVTKVGKYAFKDCTNIEKITLPVCTTVGEFAFACPTYTNLTSSLTSVNLPVCMSIGQQAFEGCRNLASVNLKKGCSIGQNTFPNNCKIMYLEDGKYAN